MGRHALGQPQAHNQPNRKPRLADLKVRVKFVAKCDPLKILSGSLLGMDWPLKTSLVAGLEKPRQAVAISLHMIVLCSPSLPRMMGMGV